MRSFSRARLAIRSLSVALIRTEIVGCRFWIGVAMIRVWHGTTRHTTYRPFSLSFESSLCRRAHTPQTISFTPQSRHLCPELARGFGHWSTMACSTRRRSMGGPDSEEGEEMGHGRRHSSGSTSRSSNRYGKAAGAPSSATCRYDGGCALDPTTFRYGRSAVPCAPIPGSQHQSVKHGLPRRNSPGSTQVAMSPVAGSEASSTPPCRSIPTGFAKPPAA